MSKLPDTDGKVEAGAADPAHAAQAAHAAHAAHIRPFLSTVPSATRPLGAALPALVTPMVTSPWLPRAEPNATAAARPAPPRPPAPTEAEIAAVYEEARTRGRADGLAELAAQRAQVAALAKELTAQRAAIAAPPIDLITEIACSVIEAWTEHAARGELFAPILRRWAEKAAGLPATVRVHPGDVAALTAAAGDAPLTIVADPALAPGALEIRSPTLELCHDWTTRLGELRAAIAAALTGDTAELAEPGTAVIGAAP